MSAVGGKLSKARDYTVYEHEKGIYLLTAAFYRIAEKKLKMLNLW